MSFLASGWRARREKLSGALRGFVLFFGAAFLFAQVERLMCRDTVSVSWTGQLYDCDFNQQLGLELPNTGEELPQMGYPNERI